MPPDKPHKPYEVVSADSHLEISVDRWADRVPDKYRERAPRKVTLANGGDAWMVEGQPLRICGLELCGKPHEEYDITGVSYEGSPGTGSPEQRLEEQDRDGVDAEVLFAGAGGPNFWRSIRDDATYLAVVRAYNTFLAEEYCAVDPARLIGLGVIPETNLSDAIAELQFCAEAGLRGVTLNAYPTGKPYPLAEDDAFWREALDMRLGLTVHVAMHFLSGTKGSSFAYERRPTEEVSGAGHDPVRRFASYALVGGFNATQMVMSGVFERVPDLRLYFAEDHLGWIPHFLEKLDQLYDRNIHWARRYYGLKGVDGRPSDYVRRHFHWGFLNEPFGVRIRHEIGVDKVMWANDFPHGDSDWPNSRDTFDAMFKDVPDDERYMMLAGNVIDYFGLAGPKAA